MNGWLAGSLTASGVLGDEPTSQAAEPWSPDDASSVWPCVAASWNSVFSALVTLAISCASQTPSEAEITFAGPEIAADQVPGAAVICAWPS